MESFTSYDFVESDSDTSAADSSENELDAFVNNASQLQRNDTRRRSTESLQDAADDFERQMDGALSATLKSLEQSRTRHQLQDQSQGAAGAGASNKVKAEKFYSQEYFDSDSDCDDTATTITKTTNLQHPTLSNDELLYDPGLDDVDARWMEARRRKHQPPSAQNDSTAKASGTGPRGGKQRHAQAQAPDSDAVLTCPACMATLCIDCQRHAVYQNQYRAMFVLNCTVDKSQMLRVPEQAQKKKKRKGRRGAPEPAAQEAAPDDPKDCFNPVYCSSCNTEVATFDSDEIYHFYNILAGYA